MMEHTPKISVLMGVYNCAATVTAAVNAIIAQTFSDWELIICDDGSTDATFDILVTLAAREPRLVLLRNPTNMGLAPTLNNCLKAARGEFTARMDGDDVCAPDRFEKELAVLEREPAFDLVSCAMEFYDDNGVYGVYHYEPYPQTKDFFKQSPFCHAGCMMRRSVLNELGGYNESDAVRRMEDYDLWFRFYSAGHKGRNLPDVLYSMYDDRQAYKRRKFKYRLTSAKLLYRSYRAFKPGVKYLPRVAMPIVKGLLPEKIYMYLRKQNLRKPQMDQQ